MLTVIYFEWNRHSNVTYFAIAERNVFSVGIECVTNLNSCFSPGMSSATVFSSSLRLYLDSRFVWMSKIYKELQNSIVCCLGSAPKET